jgi:hypothetical protein
MDTDRDGSGTRERAYRRPPVTPSGAPRFEGPLTGHSARQITARCPKGRTSMASDFTLTEDEMSAVDALADTSGRAVRR